MHAQKEVVEQIMQKLAFEVESVPKNKSDHVTSDPKSTPLNVKIRVRKKDEDNTKEYVSTTTEHMKGLQKVRLVNSDQTIMNFDVFMEAEFEKEPPPQKIRKQIFEMLKPGACLGALEDDDYTYIPSSTCSANISGPSQITKSDGTLKHTFTLSKNVYQDYTVSTQSGEQKYFFGKCKPGGCLDPPFSEDKYSYKPKIKPDPEKVIAEKNILNKEQTPETEVVESNHDGSKSNVKRNSIFDGTFFKKKRKSSEQSTNTQPSEHTDSVVNIFQGDPSVNSISTHSNSIITYPPKILSNLKVNDDKVKSRHPSEDKSRKSFNEHSEPYFIPPKGITRDKENDKMNQNETKRQSSEKNTPKEFKLPGFIPVPVPVPITFAKSDSKVTAPTDNVSSKDLLVDNIKTEGTQTPSLQLQDSSTGDTEVNPMQSFKIVALDPTDVGQLPNKNVDTESKSPNTDDLQKNESKELSLATVSPHRISEDSNLEKSESTDHNVVTEPVKDKKPHGSSDTEVELNKDKHPIENIKQKVFPFFKDMINGNEDESDSGQNLPIIEHHNFLRSNDNASTGMQSPLTTDTSDNKARLSTPEYMEKRYSGQEYLNESGDPKTDLDKDKIENIGVLENDTDTVKDSMNISPNEPYYRNDEDEDVKKVLRSGNSKDYIVAPLVIDEISTPPVKDANNKIDLIAENRKDSKDFISDPFFANIPPIMPKLDQDNIKYSAESDKKFGTKSYIYESGASVESISQTKTSTGTTDVVPVVGFRNINADTPILSSDQSANTIKSALKKDSIFIELGFISYLNDKKERVVTTFDTKHEPNRSSNDLVTIVKSQIRISSNEIRIPVDAEHDMSIQIKKSNIDQRVSISESGFEILTDNRKVINQKSTDPKEGSISSPKLKKPDEATKNGELEISVLEFYEQELIPLQLIIKNLRDEIDVLAAQQLVFRDKIFCTNKTKSRVLHSSKKCFGCLKK